MRAGLSGMLILVLAGVLLGAGGLVVVGLLVGMVRLLRSVWSRYGLRALVYERHLAADRVLWGERIELALVVRNATALPIPWLRIEDEVTHGVDIAGGDLVPSAQRGVDVLRASWSIGWFERVTRRMHVVGSRRGTYRFISAELSVADLFSPATGREVRHLPDAYRVVPRVLPVRSLAAQSPMRGASRVAVGIFEEPSLYSGVRPYQPGDGARRVHWKATARVGSPVSRRYDPARERQVLLAVDMQTLSDPYWMLRFDDDQVEGLCVAALSMARRAIEDGVAVGLAVNAFSNRPQRSVFVPPSAAPSQVGVIADRLADVSPFASMPFERLLASAARRAPAGCSIVALSARDPESFLAVLRRLAAVGFPTRHAGLGPDAAGWSERLRRVGIATAAYRLDPDWRTADALDRVA